MTMTTFDPQEIGNYLGGRDFPLDGGARRFEVVGPTSIIILAIFPESMNVAIEVFDPGGGQPLVSLDVDYCESVTVSTEAGHPTLTITQSVHCLECSARRERRFFIRVQPKLRLWNE
jgi:hypothetical protein